MVGHRMPCMRGNSMQDLWYTKQHAPVSPRQTAYLLGLQRFCQCTVVTYHCITTVKPLMSLGSWLFLGLSVKTLGGGDLREGLCPPHAIKMFWHWYKQSHPTDCQCPPLKHTDGTYDETPRQCLFFTYHYIHNVIYAMSVPFYGCMSCPDDDNSAWSAVEQRVIIDML